jgi:hypothetical protein
MNQALSENAATISDPRSGARQSPDGPGEFRKSGDFRYAFSDEAQVSRVCLGMRRKATWANTKS